VAHSSQTLCCEFWATQDLAEGPHCESGKGFMHIDKVLAVERRLAVLF
jgi:hypothetical protein